MVCATCGIPRSVRLIRNKHKYDFFLNVLKGALKQTKNVFYCPKQGYKQYGNKIFNNYVSGVQYIPVDILRYFIKHFFNK